MREQFLPISLEEYRQRGIDRPDFVYVIGDAYVDHSSFGPAIISRVLESRGYSVGIIAQPDWTREESIQVFGEPKLGFLGFRREYGLYGESLHSIEKTQTEGFLFPGRKDGASTGSGGDRLWKSDQKKL